jgi:DNA replication and repair protein RecF
MHLKFLELKNFRLFTDLALQIPNKMILVTGANAHGKTTLLEAIYFLATFSSFHASSDRQLIQFSQGYDPKSAEIHGIFQHNQDTHGKSYHQKEHHLDVYLVLDLDRNNLPRFRKQIKVDTQALKINEAIGKFNAVLFLPEMTQIIDGSPDLRRRYIDLVIAQANSHYLTQLIQYNQAMQQRNALLKTIFEGAAKPSHLDVWDLKIAQLGAFLVKTRDTILQELEIESHNNHFLLSHGMESLTIRYQPSFDPAQSNDPQNQLLSKEQANAIISRDHLDEKEIEIRFQETLNANRKLDIQRGFTTIGPHRDDIRFLSNNTDLGYYGSRGQIRTALIALKLAESTWLEKTTGQKPVLLFDEVLAELDHQRRTDLLEQLTNDHQVFLTTTDANLFAGDYRDLCEIWQMKNGIVQIT